tara:strand:- start:12 stop:404 length:393 start_codon:yes stop_codon:yes gene_type:complete
MNNKFFSKGIILESNIDFKLIDDLSHLKVGNQVLIKSSIASGWAQVVNVTRIMPTQIEVETVNVIPTIDHCRWGTKNPFVNDREKGNFFAHWSWVKQANVGKKNKFFIHGGKQVGLSTEWNPRRIAEIIK